MKKILHGQRGITRLEAAIVIVFLVAMSSASAFFLLFFLFK